MFSALHLRRSSCRALNIIPTRGISSSTLRATCARMTLVGRLADTPEIATTNSGQEVLRYAVGTSIGRGENQKTSWFKVSCIMPPSKQRDYFASLEKGTLLYVEGDASMNQYQDNNGKSHNVLNISQKRLEVLAHNRKLQSEETE